MKKKVKSVKIKSHKWPGFKKFEYTINDPPGFNRLKLFYFVIKFVYFFSKSYKHIFTMDANSDENVLLRIRQNKVVTLYAFFDILIDITFLLPSKDGRTWSIFFLESPLIKLVLLNGGKTENVNQLFSNRDDKDFKICGTNREIYLLW